MRMGMWTKLRPGVREFLRRAAERFELWIYTAGSKPYADVSRGGGGAIARVGRGAAGDDGGRGIDELCGCCVGMPAMYMQQEYGLSAENDTVVWAKALLFPGVMLCSVLVSGSMVFAAAVCSQELPVYSVYVIHAGGTQTHY